MSTENLPPGAVRTPNGGLMTVASAETNARTAPVTPKPAFALPPAVAGVLGVLALLAAVPGTVLLALPASVVAPAWLVTAAAVGGGLTPVFTGLAFWARGGNPLDLLTRGRPAAQPVTPKVGPPEP